MSNHAYKQAPKTPTRYSPVELVSKLGDQWQDGVPHGIQKVRATTTQDRLEAVDMVLMERGVMRRVQE